MSDGMQIGRKDEYIGNDFKYIMSTGDVFTYNLFLINRLRFLRVLCWSATVCIFALFLLSLFDGAEHIRVYALFSGFSIAGIFTFYWVFPVGLAGLNAVLWRLKGPYGSLNTPTHIEISTLGIKASSALAKNEVQWPAVLSVVRLKNHLFFFISKQNAFIVPRRAFADDSRFDAFHNAAVALRENATGCVSQK